MSMNDRRKSYLIHLFLLLIVVAVLLPSIPSWHKLPNRDSGVFLYAGQQILEGEIPYQDFWDHKPPGILYLNALGLLIGGGSRWGVWFLECVSLFLAASLSYRALKEAFGTIPGVFGTASWLGTLSLLLDFGNYTEEYALLFQFLIIFSCLKLLRPRSEYYWVVLLALGGVGCILLRPNLIGTFIGSVIVLAVLAESRKRLVLQGLVALVTGISVLLFISLYFMYHDAFGKMVDAAIVYNAVYIQNGLLSFQDSLYVGWKLLSINGLMTIALPTTVVGGLYTVFRRNLEKPVKRLFLLGLVVFPIETGLTAVSGRSYPHYYIAWLPSMAIFAGMFGHLLMKLGDKASTQNNFRSRLIILILVLALFGFFLPIGIQFYARLQYGRSVVTVGQLGVEYIKQETSPDDYVLMWGAETGVNFASERRSPSRFTYQYPLFHGAANADEFLLEIQRNSPVLIIDAVSTITKAYVPDAPSLATLVAMSSGASNDHLPQWSVFADYLAGNYEMVDTLGEPPTEWFVYQRIERSSTEQR